jgi:DNA polymerase-3 subunit alpha (Gram-positive type)
MTEIIIAIVVVLAIYLVFKLTINLNTTVGATKDQSQDQDTFTVTGVSHLPERFIAVDIETTGLNYEKDMITEIAAIKVNREDKGHHALTNLVNPGIPIPYEVALKTGITNDMVKNERPIEEVLGEFIDFFEDLPLAFYNAEFDLKFLRRDVKKINREINNEIIDVYSICKMAFPKLRSYKLTSIAEKLDIDTEGAHRAFDDCKLTIQVLNVAAYKIKNKI